MRTSALIAHVRALACLLVFCALAGLMERSAWAAAPSESSAATASSKVAVYVRSSDDTQALLLGELAFLGVQTELVELPAGAEPSAFEAFVRTHGFAALVHIDRTTQQAHVSAVDPASGRARSSALGLQATWVSRDVAVRATELLRTTLRELEAPPAPPPEDPEPVDSSPKVNVEEQVPPAPRRPSRAVSRFGMTMGGIVAGSPGGLSVMAGLHLGLWFSRWNHVGLMLSGVAPLLAAKVSADEGDAQIRIGWVTAGPRFMFVPNHRVVRPSVSLGVGPAFFFMTGQAVPPYRSGDAFVVTGLAEGEAALDFVVARHWRLRLAGSLGVCFTQPEVRFAGRSVARWCLPYGAGQAGVVVEW